MYTRTTPYFAKIKERAPLTGAGSTKRTVHVSLDISGSNLVFKAGDSIGILPTNHPEMVDQILCKLQATGREEIFDPRSQRTYPFRDYLLYRANISKASLHKLYPIEKTELPLIHLLEHHKPSPSELCQVLLPLLPRFYSIASSPLLFPNEIHLTVAYISYQIDGVNHFGVGSHFICELADETTPIPIYVQPAPHFHLPDQAASLILIGPGTGIAPFRAFLQERLATKAPGLNWLFFGERNRATDFYYSDFWLELEKRGDIRLDLAFSRDQEEKIYVQHKLWEQRKALWNWIQEGGYIYVCGNADKMAKDVDRTLLKIAMVEGNMQEEQARKYWRALRGEKRYLLDVY